MKAVGAYLRHLRKQRGLTQADVAEKINRLIESTSSRKPDARTMSRWERGVNVPQSDTMAAWCRVVGGDFNTVQDFLLDPGAMQQHGVLLAKKKLSAEALDSISTDDLRQAHEIITRLLRSQQSSDDSE